MKYHRSLLALYLGTVGAFSAIHFSATASVFVFNSFGPGSTYNSGADWIIGGAASLHGYQGHAEYFVPTVSGYLSQVQLGTKLLGGGSFSHVSIAQDNGSGLPGAVLEDFPNEANLNGILTINSLTTPLLQAGQKYWLCDEPQSTTTYVGWCLNNQGVINPCDVETSQGGWFMQNSPPVASCVFSVSVVQVPEPASLGLFVLAASLFAASSSRRKPSAPTIDH